MSDGPDDIADLAVGAITTSAAPTGESGGGGDGVDTSGLEAAPTPGEVMTELAPTSSDSAQNLYSEFNIDALAFANNPTINSYAVELKTEQMFEGQDDPHSEDLRSGSKTEEKDKKNRERAEALAEHFERMEAMQERQREWMERDHQVGGMHMSGRDLEGFLRVMGDPKKREQIAQKLREQGMSDNDVKKAEKEAQEFSRLKQLEKTRDLTDEEKKRLEEINNSKEFQKFSETVVKERGMTYSAQNNQSLEENRDGKSAIKKYEGAEAYANTQLNATPSQATLNQISTSKGFGAAADVKEVSPQLAKAPELTQAFTQSNVVQLASKTSPTSDFEDSLDEKPTPKKPTQVAKVQDSFSASL